MSDLRLFTTDAPPARDRLEVASPARVVPVMYDRLMRALRRAARAHTSSDTSTLKHELEVASAIVFELLGTLDFREGGELTPRLAALYGYFASEILVLGHTPDLESLDRLVEMVEILSGQWQRDVRNRREDYLRHVLRTPVESHAAQAQPD